MIRIERDSHPTDSIMDKKKDTELQKLKDSCVRKQTLEIEPLWKNDKVKKFLHQSQYGKCCYCERRRDQKRESDVEHFRPKAKLHKNPKHSGYWWLAYSWDNLLISCNKCNNRKGTKFPLKDESTRAFSEEDDLTKEEPILINPLTENPEDFIEYDIPKDGIPKDDNKPLMTKAIGKCERGDKTINVLTGINDLELLLARARSFRDYCLLYKSYKCFSRMKNNLELKKETCKAIRRKLESESEFAGFARFYFNQVGIT